jgi:hypothetical protein
VFVTTKCFNLEYQEFAGPNDCKKLACDGRPCAKCHKCRDWQFTGDRDTWKWIANYKNWKDEDWVRYDRDRIWKNFEKRSGATCYFYFYYGGGHLYGLHLYGGLGYGGLCVCEDNRRN